MQRYSATDTVRHWKDHARMGDFLTANAMAQAASRRGRIGVRSLLKSAALRQTQLDGGLPFSDVLQTSLFGDSAVEAVID